CGCLRPAGDRCVHRRASRNTGDSAGMASPAGAARWLYRLAVDRFTPGGAAGAWAREALSANTAPRWTNRLCSRAALREGVSVDVWAASDAGTPADRAV